jgi:nicotinate-nucleotide pyrophosphorylase (carboxylating)
MPRDFEQVEWDAALQADARRLAELAREEDLGGVGGVDVTSEATIDAGARGVALVVAREKGVLAGAPLFPVLAEVFQIDAQFHAIVHDGQSFGAGETVGTLDGNVRDILAIERTWLNFLGKLSGIATLTRRYVLAVAGTPARIYDTRKTTPGWRRLEKYAVRCGGGHNHRLGLHAAILIKDNHIGAYQSGHAVNASAALAQLVRAAGRSADSSAAKAGSKGMMVEIEVDSLDQLADALGGHPDLVLLDNMDASMLRQAVALRDQLAPKVELEASGGVTLRTVREIAKAGLERISVGRLTHRARWVDLGLDWGGAVDSAQRQPRV